MRYVIHETKGKVVLFTTSNWSRRTMMALRKMLKEKVIPVEKENLYSHMLNINGRMAAGGGWEKFLNGVTYSYTVT